MCVCNVLALKLRQVTSVVLVTMRPNVAKKLVLENVKKHGKIKGPGKESPGKDSPGKGKGKQAKPERLRQRRAPPLPPPSARPKKLEENQELSLAEKMEKAGAEGADEDLWDTSPGCATASVLV